VRVAARQFHAAAPSFVGDRAGSCESDLRLWLFRPLSSSRGASWLLTISRAAFSAGTCQLTLRPVPIAAVILLLLGFLGTFPTFFQAFA
jgi:hypothetical protein